MFNEPYTHRLNLFKKSRTWHITPDALRWDEQDGSGTICYDDIQHVHLKYVPTRTDRNRIALKVISKGSRIEITNIDFKGPLNFIDQTESFTFFVLALHKALAEKNQKVDYHAGRTKTGFFAISLLTAFVFAVLSTVIILLIKEKLTWIVAIKFFLLTFFLPSLVRDLTVNFPRKYTPTTLPKVFFSENSP